MTARLLLAALVACGSAAAGGASAQTSAFLTPPVRSLAVVGIVANGREHFIHLTEVTDPAGDRTSAMTLVGKGYVIGFRLDEAFVVPVIDGATVTFGPYTTEIGTAAGEISVDGQVYRLEDDRRYSYFDGRLGETAYPF